MKYILALMLMLAAGCRERTIIVYVESRQVTTQAVLAAELLDTFTTQAVHTFTTEMTNGFLHPLETSAPNSEISAAIAAELLKTECAKSVADVIAEEMNGTMSFGRVE